MANTGSCLKNTLERNSGFVKSWTEGLIDYAFALPNGSNVTNRLNTGTS